MSYDIFFVRRDPGQSFEDALEAIEDSFRGDPGPLSDVELEQWESLLPRAREILGDVEVFEDEVTRELSDPVTGIQLSLFNGEVSITVPYWHDDDQAVEVMQKVYTLAKAVEDQTGLEGYDPQIEEAISDVRNADSDLRPGGWRSRDDDEDDHASGASGAAVMASTRRALQETSGDSPTRPADRRWWEFWKR